MATRSSFLITIAEVETVLKLSERKAIGLRRVELPVKDL